MTSPVTPFALKDAPALIERLLPVQKLSAESYKEQMAGIGKTLTALGNYWKGRKPLILNKACILGCLLPATDDPKRDLEIFEKLMAMDDESIAVRHEPRPRPKDIVGKIALKRIRHYFLISPEEGLPESSPIDLARPEYKKVIVQWRPEISELERRRIEAQLLPKKSYRELVEESKRPEEVMDTVHDHIWEPVNAHLGTRAFSFPELVEQLGIMRFGHRPRVADTFCGSGQIPFEAARLGCDVYASDLSPIACILTWGAFNIVGASKETRHQLSALQAEMVGKAEAEIKELGIEEDGNGWRGKIYLYCIEICCPETGWMVPLLPSRVLSKVRSTVFDLVPDPKNKRYEILIRPNVSANEMSKAHIGTVQNDGQDAVIVHTVDGVEHRIKFSTLRGDFRLADGTVGNKLRLWEKSDFRPRPTDIFQERLYAIQWMQPSQTGRREVYEFRSVTKEDLERDRIVEDYVATHLSEWQELGLVPDMRIEPGSNTDQPIRERGWTYWHHLFNPRQLLVGASLNQFSSALLKFGFARVLNSNSRLSRFTTGGSGASAVTGAFDNQALNTLLNYGCRGMRYALDIADANYKSFEFSPNIALEVQCQSVEKLAVTNDIYVTDPPYGDAVMYDEIFEFYIAWLRKHPPPEFADWTWDSRRALAIKGDGEDFRRAMVAAYKRMTECMPDNGIQVIMFTNKSGSIWGDMANIVWAAGLHVTAAWYVATETESSLREGNYVKGTVLLVLRKRQGLLKITRDDLAWEIQAEVEHQVNSLTGLNQDAKGLYRDENVFQDADIQMAGYAAALRVLTRYAIIDGRDMTVEAIRPRAKGEITFVDELINYAVNTANEALVPQGIAKSYWERLNGAERFYLKMLDLEAQGNKTLDNYQNFAKAFKVRDFYALMGIKKANQARLRSAVEFGKNEMSESSQLYQSVLRAVLYAIMQLTKNLDGSDVLAQLMLNVPDYYANLRQRELAIELSDYLAKKLETLRPAEADAARVLRELIKNQRLA